MKLGVDVNEVTLSGTSVVGEFKIRNSAKAFKILSDGLYSNKIRAIIRELSCNALDSHVAAGRADVPFEVHLPTILEPWFSVRDYGTGLDDNQVMNIYTTYFESTKTESNDFIGALGLGSKSPFSYTENFTVTAIKDGIQRIYSAFINEQGVPSVVAMGEGTETDEHNGVEVKFSVTERYDYNSFQHEARNVFKWFKNKPVITGVDNFEIGEVEYSTRDIVPGVHYTNGRYSYAVMGNIAYPLDKIPEPQKHFGTLAELLSCGLVIEFNIGDLDFAASREELSYIPLTIASIKHRLEELNSNLAQHVASLADAITDKWEKSQFLYTKRREKLFTSAVHKYVADTKFPLFSSSNHYNYSIRVTEKDLDNLNLSLTGFTVSYGNARNTGMTRSWDGKDYIQLIDIPVTDNIVIVLNDLKTGCGARAKYHFVTENKPVTVLCISHSDPDPAKRKADYDKLIEFLHNPPCVVQASSLNKKPAAEKLSTSGILYMKKKPSSSYYRNDETFVWQNQTAELDENTTYYYVPMSGGVVLGPDGKPWEHDIKLLAKNMANSGIKEISGICIYGVRKSRIDELKDLDNWVPLTDHLKKIMSSLNQKKINAVIARNLLDSYSYRSYTSSEVAKLLPKDSPYREFYEFYKSVEADADINSISALAKMFGNSVDVDKITKEVQKTADGIMKRYPMIGLVSYIEEKVIADYIKLIDKQEKTDV